MPTNDFLPFATGAGANVETQANYILESYVGAGFASGLAQSAQLNKVWRQSSFIAAALAQWIVDKANVNVLDDGNVAGLETNFTAALAAWANPTYLTISSASSTYLTISNASSTYLTIANATATYLTQSNAAATYLTQSSAASTYLTQANAASTYLTIGNASATYVPYSYLGPLANYNNMTAGPYLVEPMSPDVIATGASYYGTQYPVGYYFPIRVAGTYRLVLKSTARTGNSSWVWYKNGVALSGLNSNPTLDTWYTTDVALAVGDNVQLWVQNGSSSDSCTYRFGLAVSLPMQSALNYLYY